MSNYSKMLNERRGEEIQQAREILLSVKTAAKPTDDLVQIARWVIAAVSDLREQLCRRARPIPIMIHSDSEQGIIPMPVSTEYVICSNDALPQENGRHEYFQDQETPFLTITDAITRFRKMTISKRHRYWIEEKITVAHEVMSLREAEDVP